MLKAIARRALAKSGYTVTRDNDALHIKRAGSGHRCAVYESLYSKEVLDRKPFINIGSGSFYHPYWTNVDYVSDWYSGVQKNVIHYDIMGSEPLPIPNGSIEIAYTSHTIEHVKEDAVFRLFEDVFRVLNSGGIFRVTTGPDAETDYRALMAGDSDWFCWDETYRTPEQYAHLYHAKPTSVPLAERWLHHVASCLAPNDKSPSPVKYNEEEIMEILRRMPMHDALDFFTAQCPFDPQRPGNHVSWWTHDKIMNGLRQAGFSTVYRSGHQQSISPLMRRSSLFDSTWPQMSIYVEAIK